MGLVVLVEEMSVFIIFTVYVTSETTYTNSLLPNTASSDTEQHVNNANSGGVDAEFAK
jgi:hypothetical protein